MKKLLLSISLIGSLFSNAQSIVLDTNYGTNGYATFDSRTTDHNTYSKILNDGSTLVSSSRYNTSSGSQESLLIKYTPTGNIDSSFGTNGVYIIPHNDDNGVQFFLDNSENIYLFANIFESKMFKLLPTGSLDISFGNNGSITLFDNANYFTPDYATIVNDGIIIGASYTFNTTEKTVLKKIDFDGNFLSSFATNGSLELDFNLYEIASPEDNSFFIAGGYDDNSFTIIKFNSNGGKDLSFATNGELTDTRSTVEYFNIYKIENNYYTNIFYENTTSSEVSKYDLNGSLDTTFATNGILAFASTLITDVLVYQNNLHILGFNVPEFKGFIYSYNLNGAINPNFSNNGKYDISSNGYKNLPLNIYTRANSFIITGNQRHSDNDVKHYASKYDLSSATASVDVFSKNGLTITNPTQNNIEVKSLNHKVINLKLYSLNGRLIKTSKNEKMSVNELSNNVYLLNCQLDNGKIIHTKIIKE